MNNIIFDNLKPEYIDSLTELDNLCFTIPWTSNMFRGDLSNKNAYYVLALVDNTVIGYGGVYTVVGESGITNIAVHPDYRQLGLATEILNMIIKHCEAVGSSFVTLEVRKSNCGAIKLYKNNGFEEVGLRKNYYSDNHESALLMTKHLKGVK